MKRLINLIAFLSLMVACTEPVISTFGSIGGTVQDAKTEAYLAGVKVTHMNNPLLHTGIDTSEAFLKKAETAVRTLSRLPRDLRCKTGLEVHASRLRRLRLDGVFVGAFSCVASAVRRQLLGRNPSVSLLQLYKLYLYLKIQRNGVEA